METIDFSMDQVRTMLAESGKLGSESGQDLLREAIADWFDKAAANDCFKPDLNAIARDIRSGVIGGAPKADLLSVDLDDPKAMKAYRLGLRQLKDETRKAIARENLRCRTLLKLKANEWQKVGMGVTATRVHEMIQVIAPVDFSAEDLG